MRKLAISKKNVKGIFCILYIFNLLYVHIYGKWYELFKLVFKVLVKMV